MARPLATLLLLLATLGAVPGARAEDRPALPAPTPACRVPDSVIASSVALTRTGAVLRQGGVLRVLAIGSSSTAGIGASSPTKSYPAQLERILERTYKNLDIVMVNRGVSGEAAALTAQRIRMQVALEKPGLVLWQVGTNDALARVPIEDFEQTITEVIRWVADQDVELVLVGLQYTPRMARDGYYGAVRATLERVAAREHVLLVRRFEAMQYLQNTQPEAFLASDGIHLNDLGYRCMAEVVARAIATSALAGGSLTAKP